MKCIYCKKGTTEVVNSRPNYDQKGVWRRRKCKHCSEVFTTSEVFSYDSWFVVKRNLTRKRFVYEKLFASILYAVSGGKHDDQGDNALLAKGIAEKAIDKLLSDGSKYIASKEIIVVVYDLLRKEYSHAAMRYSMYSPFRLKVLKSKMV
jgi:transcriptional regulator NrdR family protein